MAKGFNLRIGDKGKCLWITNTNSSEFVSILESGGHGYQLSYENFHELVKNLNLADEQIKELEKEKHKPITVTFEETENEKEKE